VDKPTKANLRAEVRSRRRRGHALKEADIIREALVEYFDRRSPNGEKEQAVAA
jgi:hypothetical protein